MLTVGVVGVACVASFAILKIIDLFIGLRVSVEQEVAGLDRSLHGEEGYDLSPEPAYAFAAAPETADDFAGYGSEVALEGAGGD